MEERGRGGRERGLWWGGGAEEERDKYGSSKKKIKGLKGFL